MAAIPRLLSWKELLKHAKEGKKIVNVGGVKGLIADTRSFNLSKAAPHGITFHLRYRKNGLLRYYPLPIGLSLTDARTFALEIRVRIDRGRDPLEEKRKKQKKEKEQAKNDKAMQFTFRQAFEHYLADGVWNWKRPGKAKKLKLQIAEKHIFPVIGDMPLVHITTACIGKLLNDIYKFSPATEVRVRNMIKKTFSKARTSGRIENLVSPFNDELVELLAGRTTSAPAQHLGALDFREIGAFIEDILSDPTGPSIVGLALIFSIQTAARSQAVRFAKWKDIDFKNRTWTIPIENDKIKTPNRNRTIYLSSAALDLLLRLPRFKNCPYIFPLPPKLEPFDENAFGRLIKKLHEAKKAKDGLGWIDLKQHKAEEAKRVTQHGTARSAFKTWAIDDENGNFLRYPPEASEYCLLHLTGDPYRGAYARAEFRVSCVKLMNDWGEFCMKGIDLDRYIPKRP